jgi:opacity protein-like surface antigen
MRRFAYAAGLAAFLFAIGAHAQEAGAQAPTERNLYAGVFAGAAMPDEETLFGFNEAGVLRDIVIDFDSTTYLGANLGVVVADGASGMARAEVELSHWQASVDALSLNDVDRVVLDGSEASVTAGFINAWYDSPRLFNRMRLSVGIGAGIAGVDNEVEYLVANAAATGGQAHIAIPSTEVTYAYQLMAGIEFDLSPGWSLVGDVRKIELGDYQVERYILNTPGVGAGTNGTLDSILDADWSATTFGVGLRHRF